MEQRYYRGAISAEGLADYLVSQYDPREDVQAQKIGKGDSWVVQLGGGDNRDEIRHALTVAIAENGPERPGVTVTMGQQKWFDRDQANHAAFWGLISAIITPWALLMLLRPATSLAGDLAEVSPGIVWNTIDAYAATQGAVLEETKQVA